MSRKSSLVLASLIFSLSLPLSAGRKKPAWVNGPDPKYPETMFVTGVGIGSDLDSARSNARAEIARTFQARIEQTLTDIQTESSTSSGKRRTTAEGTQKSQIDTKLTTDTLLEGVTVVETYFDNRSKKNYALAVLDKMALRRSLSSQILEKEQEIASAKSHAERAATALERARALSSALAASEERDDLATRRRVIDPAGMASLSGGSTGDLENMLDKTLADIPVSVTAEGPEGSKLSEAVVSQITALGVSVSASNTTGLVVNATLEVAPFERGVPEWTFFQWTGTVKITDLATGKTIASATKDGVEGHLTRNTAKSKTIAAGENALAQEGAKLLQSQLFGL